jgi:acyl carrier protein
MTDSTRQSNLPEMPEGRLGSVEFVAPRSELERALGRMWADVLALDRIGIHDDFFDIGGHSQLLVRLQLKISELIKTEVPVTALFEYRTIDSLAKYLDSASA